MRETEWPWSVCAVVGDRDCERGHASGSQRASSSRASQTCAARREQETDIFQFHLGARAAQCIAVALEDQQGQGRTVVIVDDNKPGQIARWSPTRRLPVPSETEAVGKVV